MTPTHRWTGHSGTGYYYEIYPIGTPMAELPGNYALCRQAEGRWEALYFGEAESLASECAAGNKAWDQAIADGATHLHAKVTHGGRDARAAERSDLAGALTQA